MADIGSSDVEGYAPPSPVTWFIGAAPAVHRVAAEGRAKLSAAEA